MARIKSLPDSKILLIDLTHTHQTFLISTFKNSPTDFTKKLTEQWPPKLKSMSFLYPET